MKLTIKGLMIFLFLLLVLTNTYIFMVGIKSSNELSKMETELEKLKQDNIELETRLSHVNSLEYAASVAASLNFQEKTVPTYLDSLEYALNR
ncbi:hypothetical protein COS31_02810 [Candidatus Roizmanbacteria bacterium CG02_land_8_20_14_3_00_36_15]|uniref:Uncharacterized protein n=2 Tax=Candidatus Roizmaniibacteriota TaxID=1752723 RepID=A0A2M8KM90_9BACT|nr:MAG: hypothetical protein COS51_01280 [Candidatus Roizmanbacteria bacterium CG03_land_8_20_14_0_80_36_21]PIV37779.1 MAG: hypothetical protein COS31_02810 [Candidatus Roizmanbacteria bacterium CG02_land_8_20_14_3_00_36_15]PIY70021.1 MAG: hypothetical protein COY89_03415 [Candidatus Roizmanbacteria bacterium CG_4_10_14_0_8_um_filter_36_36]PJA52889.1 MAG: hypothetical protein CO166_03905 [Candidatus Roizmanbacteria bacterium CG_4_9_14_3_um_filter_36_11]PJC81636.1 MAG: hypothetical protein CO007